jgi:hypothetical protein
LFGFCASACGLFKSHSVLFILNVVAEIGERGTRGCVIVVAAAFVGGGRSVDLRRRKRRGGGIVLVHGTGAGSIEGREGGGCRHGGRHREFGTTARIGKMEVATRPGEGVKARRKSCQSQALTTSFDDKVEGVDSGRRGSAGSDADVSQARESLGSR